MEISQITIFTKTGNGLKIFNAKDFDNQTKLELNVKDFCLSNEKANYMILIYSDNMVIREEIKNVYDI